MNTFFRTLKPDVVGYASSRNLPRRRSCSSCLVLMAGILAGGMIFGQSAFGATSAAGPAGSTAGVSGMNAEVNGARMTAGATLFPGDVIRLGTGSSAALQFGKTLLLAAPLTEFVVESAGVSLRSGRLQVRASGGESFAVSGPFFRVNVAPSGGALGSAEIRVGGKYAQILAVAGTANLTAAGDSAPYRLHAGETATLNAANADAEAGQLSTSPSAGEVSRLLPQVKIDRSSQQLVAAVSSPVYWNDDLRSASTGRARITLKDGSLLSLGPSSELRVLQHDAQAQQTSLDLAIGRLRGQVVKLTRPGAKFEIRTPMGVAGLVGTDFYFHVTPSYTELIVAEGAVSFTPFSSGPAVTVNAGMKLRISRAGTLEGPSPTTPQEIQTAEKITDVPDIPVQGAASSPLMPVVVSVSTGAAVVGIGSWLDTREGQPVSPSTPSGTTPANVN